MTDIAYYKSTGSSSIDVVVVLDPSRDEPVLTANAKHPHYEEIVRRLENGDESVFELFDVGVGVASKLSRITDRVSWDGRNVLWDGDPVHTVLADQIARSLESGLDDYAPLARFWEKLESNPEEHSREQAYDWLASHEFQITEEGDVVGYKGVTLSYNAAADGTPVYHSAWASKVPGVPSAYVNGNAIPPQSRVPQTVGDVVSMPRSEVVHDPTQACKRGLHVATRSYAESYGSVVLEVHVNPRDIVSVPTDGAGEKVRACRYTVARVAVDASEYGKSPVLSSSTNTWAGGVGYVV